MIEELADPVDPGRVAGERKTNRFFLSEALASPGEQANCGRDD